MPKPLQFALWVGLLSGLFSSLLYGAQLNVKSQVHQEEKAEKIEDSAVGWKHEVTPQKTSEPVTLVLTGDLMLGRYIGTLMERKGGAFPFSFMPDLLTHIASHLGVSTLDIVAGNLEGPIVQKQLAFGDMIFRFDPKVAPLLKTAGFTTFQLANNHIFNQGRAGFTETQTHLNEAGLNYFGEADTPTGASSFLVQNIKGMSIGFLGLNDVDFKLDMEKTVEEIQRRDKEVDFLIIGVHWGYEYEATARQNIVEKAHAMVDAGADFIWGTHPHVVQNSEEYKQRWIYYSLGNFVFDQYWSAATQKGLVLGLKIESTLRSESSEASQVLPQEEGSFQVTVQEFPVQLVNQGEPQLSTTLVGSSSISSSPLLSD